MKILVTGSSGHLGEALVRTLRNMDHRAIGLDLLPSPFTDLVGSITNRSFVKEAMKDVEAILHTATLHKPHIETHSYQQFIDVNITGTLYLLEEAVAAGVKSFVYTSTTSTFGDALVPKKDCPAVWINEEVKPIPKNIYGVTKTSAEDLCRIFHRDTGLPCTVLRTSRFFPEEDDNRLISSKYRQDNVQANEFLYRRVDIEDVVDAHLLALEKADELGFDRYIISATTPFTKSDLLALHQDAPRVIKRLFPDYEEIYKQFGWKMFPVIERVYVNERAKQKLGWQPTYDFRYILDRLKEGKDLRSELAKAIGSKGYHQNHN
ncbi:NAD(P)-dependent oxidoreductase [Olivibacter sp. CPCC 100613]|uniref:NAD-dependent epimerase/dehydratase family protein n=1 Tax=Olivibacter sp. CPCC 100613 TaxID=3079931 RepID=UPI002FF59B9C